MAAARAQAQATAEAYLASPENVDMDHHLQNNLRISNVFLRANIVRNGFKTAVLPTKKPSFVTKLATSIRKMTGNIETRNVTAEDEENLEKTVIFARYQHLTSRPVGFQLANPTNLDAIWSWYEAMAASKDGDQDEVPKFSDTIQKREWFEAIQNRLGSTPGAAGFPILYVIREAHVPVNPPDTVWNDPIPDFNTDLQLRGQHGGSDYISDNRKVWSFLRSITFGTTAWPTIANFATSRNGHGAYHALQNQYLGPDVRRLLMQRAEQFLGKAKFDGKARNFTYDKFLNKMRRAFMDLEPQDSMSETRKVEKLLNAWQVPGMEHCATTIRATPLYATNFEHAATFLGEALTHRRMLNSDSNKRSIGSLQHHKGGKGSHKGGKGQSPHKKWKRSKFDKSKAAEYLPASEWHALTEEEKTLARQARKKKGIPSREEKRSVSALAQAKIPSCSPRQVAAVMAAMNLVEDGVPMDVDTSPTAASPSGGGSSTLRKLKMTQRERGPHVSAPSARNQSASVSFAGGHE